MDTKTLCLGILSRGEASGYEIKKHFEEAFSHYFVAGFGSIYPALAELTRRELIVCSDVVQEKRPAKKVYSLTRKGRKHLQQELAETYPRHKVRSEFMVLLTFAHLLREETLQDVIETRKNDIHTTLQHIDNCLQGATEMTAGERHTIGFAQAVLGAGLDYLEKNGDLMISEINDERSKSPRKGDLP